MIWNLASAAVFVVAVVALLAGGPRRFMRGRHVSRPLLRRLGWGRTVLIRRVGIWSGVPLGLTHHLAAWTILMGLCAAWAIDDWLFSDDDDRKRKHEWARVRLRMPKPVKLRPVEKWVPAHG